MNRSSASFNVNLTRIAMSAGVIAFLTLSFLAVGSQLARETSVLHAAEQCSAWANYQLKNASWETIYDGNAWVDGWSESGSACLGLARWLTQEHGLALCDQYDLFNSDQWSGGLVAAQYIAVWWGGTYWGPISDWGFQDCDNLAAFH